MHETSDSPGAAVARAADVSSIRMIEGNLDTGSDRAHLWVYDDASAWDDCALHREDTGEIQRRADEPGIESLPVRNTMSCGGIRAPIFRKRPVIREFRNRY